MILVTGASGLIGRHLCARFERAGIAFRPFDHARTPEEDIRDPDRFAQALEGATGVVHLAAVSRVVWGERDPDLCWRTNVVPLETLREGGLARSGRFMVFASSREVYGEQETLPVPEHAPFAPMNVYARSKVAGEGVVQALRDEGMVANICRFSSVFGCPQDHPDRVVPAFAAAAARGGVIRMEGRGNTFDFTAVEDAVDGLFRLVEASARGERLPPLHFVSGRGTTLEDLARSVSRHAAPGLEIVDAPARNFDVGRFVGDPSRALQELGWKAETDLEDRLARFVGELRAVAA
ncbi:NAD-dependent epimerase/dehydratase family protein [Albimonas sp. CAU 1670]|uniref:NAD-dependent epimerase/dehydratase family protein n=1 Tax=Albimonas sp. CAU 1670 TaxID=3032599 RepID=UPI0023D9A246|nr:NAD-dependent epimerase/dehydratase family protein [Albimonas sp. CAU 1670]MDF2234811.1 NAD-dependent epimerase/dehydratase family protein [Albimonas sp. CAU 1670]